MVHDARQHRKVDRDGISGLVTHDRALRAREVSQPTPDDRARAEQVLPDLLARLDGRRRQ